MGLLRRTSKEAAAPKLGYLGGFAEQYELGQQLGKGGNGVVRLAVHKQTGREYAVKSIVKVLCDPQASERKKASQIPYLKQEVEVMLALRGTLNVANLEEVYEDSTHVHLVLELCKGGELVARAKGRHYSERTVASFMRAVLRTVAQCHAKNILHRDIKPENFLLLDTDDACPVKAIDFGLAMFYDPASLPVTGLNVEGTPWYLAPEVCRGKWFPSSDVWACGIMAAYLMTGHYPFVDKISPDMPDLARTLRHICFDPLDLSGQEWVPLSEEARQFITYILVKDPLQRPSALDALAHPWLKGAGASERGTGTPLDRSVVQRLQRFAQSSLFKRSVLQHIAQDLVAMHFSPDPTAHGGAVFKDRSVRGGALFRGGSLKGGSAFNPYPERSFKKGSAFTPYGEWSLKGGSTFSPFAAAAEAAAAGAEPGGDRTVRGGSMRRSKSMGSALGGRQGSGGGDSGGNSGSGGGEGSTSGGSRMKRSESFLERSVRAGSEFLERSINGGAAFWERARSGAMERSKSGVLDQRGPSGSRDGTVRGGGRAVSQLKRAESSMYLPVATPYSRRLAKLFDKLGLDSGDKQISQEELTAALKGIGYKITEEEGAELFSVIDTDRQGKLGKAELSAGLMDWKAFQDTYKDRWLESVRRVFEEMDIDGSGEITADEIAHTIGSHLSPYEVDAAVHLALLEAAGGEGGSEGALQGIDFDHFVRLLRDGSDALDNFEDRLSNHTSRNNTAEVPPKALKELTKGGLSKASKSTGTGAAGQSGGGCCCVVQ